MIAPIRKTSPPSPQPLNLPLLWTEPSGQPVASHTDKRPSVPVTAQPDNSNVQAQPKCYYCRRHQIDCLLETRGQAKCICYQKHRTRCNHSKKVPNFAKTKQGKLLKETYFERDLEQNAGETGEAWTPVNPDVRVSHGLKSRNVDLRQRCVDHIAYEQLQDEASKKRKRASVKATDLNSWDQSILYNKEEANKHCLKLESELREQARILTELVEKFNNSVIVHNFLVEVHSRNPGPGLGKLDQISIQIPDLPTVGGEGAVESSSSSDLGDDT